MKKLFILIVLISSVSLLFAQKTQFLLDKQFKDFIPIPAIEYEPPIILADTIGVFDTLTIKELACNKDKLEKFLTDQSVYVTIEQVNSEGSIVYAPASASVNKGNYTVNIDFVKFNTIDLIMSDGESGGFVKVGVGLRIRANIKTKKRGLNIGNLFGLAIAAEQNKLSGTLSFDVIGIDSKEVTTLIPIPTEISQTSIQNALQAMATIKSKLSDNQTQLHPKIVAIKSMDDGGIKGIIKQIKEEEKRLIQAAQEQQQQQRKGREEVQQRQG